MLHYIKKIQSNFPLNNSIKLSRFSYDRYFFETFKFTNMTKNIMTEALLEYNVAKIAGEGYVATCVINPKISVFAKSDDDLLKTGIHSAAKLYAKLHPTEENTKIRNDEFQMKLVK